jgi:hypothetical protein
MNKTFQDWSINFEVSDLLTKMTYSEPNRRPNIQEVHSHPFVVNRPVNMNNTKIINRKMDENVVPNWMFNKFDHEEEKRLCKIRLKNFIFV